MKSLPSFLRLSVVVFATSLISLSVRAELITGLTTTNQLVTFDSATPGTLASPVTVTGLQSGESLVGLDRRPATGGLYALGSSNQLYLVDPFTGVATQVGAANSFTLSGTAFGTDFNPTSDRLRVISSSGQNLRINPSTGTLAATDTNVAYAAGDPFVGSTPVIVGSAYTNNFAGALGTSLYNIDSSHDTLALQFNPNGGSLMTIGVIGFNTSNLVGFDISGLSGIAFASLTAPGGSSSQLFTINLTTGNATLVGTIGGGAPLVGLTASVGVPTPDFGSSMILLGLGLFALAAYSWISRERI